MSLLAALLALVLLGAGCSGTVDLDTEDPVVSPTPTEEPARPIADARAPDAAYSLIPATDPAELAIGVSRAYLVGAQVAVLAPQDDRDAVLRAASIAAASGAPALLSSPDDATLDVELLRLGVVGVVTVGAVDLDAIDTTSLIVAPAPDDAAELGAMLGTSLTGVPLPEPGGDDVAALLDLADGEVFAPGASGGSDGSDGSEGESTEDESTEDQAGTEGSDAEGTEDAETSEATDATEPADDASAASTEPVTGTSPAQEPTAVGELPALTAAEPVEDSVVIAGRDQAQLTAIGTALAVGADVLRTAGDPRADEALVESLGAADPSSVVGLGTAMGDEETFTWRAQTAATGTQLPGGAQLVTGKRYVALYGSPVTPSLGLLGEQGVDETIDRAERYAARYRSLTEDTVVPALEIIVTVASSSAGDDGDYSNEWDPETFVPLIEAAADAGQYVVLDFQPGRSSFLEQVREYEELLAYPHVGIALDPEWRLKPDQVHLQQIGSVATSEVNEVIEYVADYVRENQLPQKLVVLHQFQLRMITDRQDLDMTRSEVALLIHADGQGSQGAKQATWRTLHEDAPEGVMWGWKNFVDEDSPMLTPEQTYRGVDPVPDFVSYQ